VDDAEIAEIRALTPDAFARARKDCAHDAAADPQQGTYVTVQQVNEQRHDDVTDAMLYAYRGLIGRRAEDERLRGIGVDPARVIGGETARKEIESD
jgi:hypothetical protein